MFKRNQRHRRTPPLCAVLITVIVVLGVRLFGRRATLLMTPTDAGLNERVDIAVEHGLGLRSLIAGAQILTIWYGCST